MKKHIEELAPFQTYHSLDYMRGLNDALSRRGSVINTLLGIVEGGGGFSSRDISPKTTVARLKLPPKKNYDGDPFAEPYAGDFRLDVVDICMPNPRHARRLGSFVQRVRLGLTTTASDGASLTRTQDFNVNDRGMLFAGGGLHLLLQPEVEVGYIPVRQGRQEIYKSHFNTLERF